MKLNRVLGILLSVVFGFQLGAMAQTADAVMQKAAAAASRSISGTFSANVGGRTLKGSVNSAGGKFSIVTPATSTWYDGQNMWTYNPATKETTLVRPSASEIAESNPFGYLQSWKSQYKCSFSSKKVTGKYMVVLTPKTKYASVKSVEIAIDAKSYKPSSFRITGNDGSASVINIITLNYGGNIPQSAFVYPKNKYRGVQIVDLR